MILIYWIKHYVYVLIHMHYRDSLKQWTATTVFNFNILKKNKIISVKIKGLKKGF